jgi:chromosome segregation ATPase
MSDMQKKSKEQIKEEKTALKEAGSRLQAHVRSAVSAAKDTIRSSLAQLGDIGTKAADYAKAIGQSAGNAFLADIPEAAFSDQRVSRIARHERKARWCGFSWKRQGWK